MELEDECPGLRPAGAPRFDTTHWSIVLAAGGTDSREVALSTSRTSAASSTAT